jgi:hypothetical protein
LSRRSELHVISALKDKRGELSGLIEHLERQLGQHRADLIHVDAVIRLYAPEVEPNADIPARAVRERNSWFRNGECARMVCDLLRDVSEPIPTGAIVNSIMQEKGIPGGDIRARDLIHRTVLSSLSRSPSVIERVTVEGQISWRVRG